MLGKLGGGDGKQNPVLIAVLVVVIAAGGFMVFKTMTAGNRPAGGPGMEVGPAMPGGPGGMGMPGRPGLGGPPPGAPGQAPGAPGGQPAPGASAPAPAPAPAAPAPAPQAAPQAAPAQKGSAPPAAAPAPKPGPQEAMRQINVFGTVGVSYPASWKISSSGGNASAVFTNGKAFFEVRPPDPRATSAQAIAQSGLKSLGSGAKVTAQGAGKVGQYDSYWMSVSYGGGTARIVGVDAPTRVVLLQRVKGAQFSTYSGTFEKMQSGMRFGG
jgi:hypothetical protein